MKKVHELKTWQQPFDDVWNNEKTFEVRKDDRGFRLGDELLLREFDHVGMKYLDGRIQAKIIYLISLDNFLPCDGHVAMGIKVLKRQR